MTRNTYLHLQVVVIPNQKCYYHLWSKNKMGKRLTFLGPLQFCQAIIHVCRFQMTLSVNLGFKVCVLMTLFDTDIHKMMKNGFQTRKKLHLFVCLHFYGASALFNKPRTRFNQKCQQT